MQLVEQPKVDLATDYHRKVDAFEAALVRAPQLILPITHRFAPGIYLREMRAPAGAWITSKIHVTDHPFIVSAGELSVLQEDGKWIRIRAPFTGITKAGTRRLAYMHTDVVWTTIHATDETDPDVIESRITLEHTDHLGLNTEDLSALKEIQRGVQLEQLTKQETST